jgi:formate--tetrahydrofolate ligase
MSEQALKDLETIEKLGLGKAAVCMAKTHLSLSHDAKLLNRPSGFVVPIRGLVASTGAGFVVALCGEMQRMPGLGKTPAFMKMHIDENGRTVGLT